MGENETDSTTKFVLSKVPGGCVEARCSRWSERVIGGSYKSYRSFEDNTKATRCRRQESDTPNDKSIAPADGREHYRRDILGLDQSNAPQGD